MKKIVGILAVICLCAVCTAAETNAWGLYPNDVIFLEAMFYGLIGTTVFFIIPGLLILLFVGILFKASPLLGMGFLFFLVLIGLFFGGDLVFVP